MMHVRKLCRDMVFCSKLFRYCTITCKAAEKELCNFYENSKPYFSQENHLNKAYDLMIILPVYNVEAYLCECLDSLFSQCTTYSYCVVAVNDGSTDRSAEILNAYGNCENLRVISQKNRGRSGARNRGLEEICGRYVMFVDPDDYLPENAIQVLLDAAFEHDADVAAGGYSVFSEKGIIREERFCSQIKQVSHNEMHGFNCMKVIKADKLKNFCFPDGFEFEDTVWSKLVFPTCERLYMIPDIVYCYRMHESNISSSLQNRKECLDTWWITKYCLEESDKHGMRHDSSEYRLYLHQCWVNYLRTRHLPEDLKQSIFVVTSDLLMKYFSKEYADLKGKEFLLHAALKRRSYDAYVYLMDRWEIM